MVNSNNDAATSEDFAAFEDGVYAYSIRGPNRKVALRGDPLRDTPTTLDTILGAGSEMLIFIISLVKSEKPRIRAFYEGKPDREIPIVVKDIANKSY